MWHYLYVLTTWFNKNFGKRYHYAFSLEFAHCLSFLKGLRRIDNVNTVSIRYKHNCFWSISQRCVKWCVSVTLSWKLGGSTPDCWKYLRISAHQGMDSILLGRSWDHDLTATTSTSSARSRRTTPWSTTRRPTGWTVCPTGWPLVWSKRLQDRSRAHGAHHLDGV